MDGVFAEDPKRNPQARRYAEITYDEVVAKGLNVMDQSAFILARDHNIPIHVFDASDRSAMRKIAEGEPTGTYVGHDAVTRLIDS